MGHRLTGIVTQIGDQSYTELGTGMRVEKNSPPIEILGVIDELNSWIGVLVALSNSQDAKDVFGLVQHDLVDLSAQISVPGTPLLSQAHLTRIEASFERINAGLGILKEIILPGGVPSASFGHVARSVCRRAERQLVSFIELDAETVESMNRKADLPLSENFGLCYLNRLSDLLFVASRAENRMGSRDDALWERGKSLCSSYP